MSTKTVVSGWRLIALSLVIVLSLVVTAFLTGHACSIRHVIEDSVIFTVDRYDPDDPEASAWNGYDQLIYIRLDDDIYPHGMYQG